LWREYQNEWGKHLIRVETDDTCGDVGEDSMKGIRGKAARYVSYGLE